MEFLFYPVLTTVSYKQLQWVGFANEGERGRRMQSYLFRAGVCRVCLRRVRVRSEGMEHTSCKQQPVNDHPIRWQVCTAGLVGLCPRDMEDSLGFSLNGRKRACLIQSSNLVILSLARSWLFCWSMPAPTIASKWQRASLLPLSSALPSSAMFVNIACTCTVSAA